MISSRFPRDSYYVQLAANWNRKINFEFGANFEDHPVMTSAIVTNDRIDEAKFIFCGSFYLADRLTAADSSRVPFSLLPRSIGSDGTQFVSFTFCVLTPKSVAPARQIVNNKLFSFRRFSRNYTSTSWLESSESYQLCFFGYTAPSFLFKIFAPSRF